MQLSARNQLKGTITAITKGPVSTEVIVEICDDVQIVSSLTTASAMAMDLKVGDQAYAVIKASSVMIAKD